ncbi:MAG: hypothetical protein IJ519_03190, partial [Clostridia bacterium]|nr:hypothetical protein [Clostridia bacterium]
IGLVLVFAILFLLTLHRFLPTFGQADLTDAQPIYRENRLYFNNLTRKNQFLYDALVETINEYGELSEEIRYTYTSEDFNDVVEHIIADNPEYFFVDFDKLESFVSETHTMVRVVYQTDIDTIKAMREELDAKVEEIVSHTEDMETEFERELYLHDYLVRNCTYLTEPGTENYEHNTAYGALCRGEAYCDGYALAFKLLVNRADMFCCVVEGTVDGIDHMWNIVGVDGIFSHVDVTWNDSDNADGDGMLYHGYMNLTEERMLKNRTIYEHVELPIADEQFDYYDAIRCTATDDSSLRSVLHDALVDAKSAGRDYIEIKIAYQCSDGEIKEAFHDVIGIINAEGEHKFIDAFTPSYCTDDKRIINYKIFYEV